MDVVSYKPRVDVITQELDGELVIYDEKSVQCHVLNPAAAIVWRHGGGEVSIDELAVAVAMSTDLPEEREIPLVALEELNKAGLLDGEPIIHASKRNQDRRRMFITAAGLTFVASLLTPIPAMAQSGGPTGGPPGS